MIDEEKLRQRMQRIAELVRQMDTAADSGVRAQSRELLESVMDLHGEAIERLLGGLRSAGEAGEQILGSLASDPVVSSVLLLYGLHPLDFDARVRAALEKVRPTLRSYGAVAELSGDTAGVVRIRVRGVDSAFTARTVKAAIEDELYAAAPDATSIVFIGLENFASPDFVPLEKVGLLAGKAGD